MKEPVSSSPDPIDLNEALLRHFGFGGFRIGQQAVIEAVLAGRDCLAVMPTGGGKSLCFQLPALLRSGLSLVISPLIALMQDQVEGLARQGIAATFINSTLSSAALSERLRGIAAGRYDLVYVAPERFRSPRFLEALGQTEVSLFAVDEAHCVSMWGHDFRPDYLRLGEALAQLGQPQVLCLTATATPEVREDIGRQLALGQAPRAEPEVVVRGFARPQLTLGVSRVRGRDDKYRRALEILSEARTGIIYCATRKNVERVTQLLQRDGLSAVGYHAGMGDQTRRETQALFTTGAVEVVVATNAFGMGIDRADVRAIIHWDVPGSLESYYQEAGRAGRDDQPAHCELLYNYADVRTQEFFIEGANPAPALVRSVGREVLSVVGASREGVALDAAGLAERLTPGGRGNVMAIETALGILQRLGVLQRDPGADERRRSLRAGAAAADLEELDLSNLVEKAERDRARLRRLLAFVNSRECRHLTILRYFGDPAAEGIRARRCDNCLRQAPGAIAAGRPPSDQEWDQVQKALSCVARLRGRVGRNRVAQVLSGSKDQTVLRMGLDQLSTYGLLAALTLGQLRALLDALEDAGCLETVGDEYPTIRLTEQGAQVMRRELPLLWNLPEPAPPKPRRRRGGPSAAAATEPLSAASADLAQALRQWRAEEARGSGRPAYHFLTNAALEAVARDQPRSEVELLAIKGIGPAKLQAFGAAILAIVQEHAEG